MVEIRHPFKLDIGSSGPSWQCLPLEEWTHLDCVAAPHVELVTDFGAIRLPDGVCDEIHLGDVIEHVPVWRLDEVLREWNRVCAPGARVTGRSPNPDRCLRDYHEGKMSLADLLGALYGKGDCPEQVHYMTYGRADLSALFAKYGFEVTDFSGSPGPADRSWWHVFAGVKVRDL